MLEIQLNMNSPVEDILAFKTCCGLKMFDANLEILITNRGKKPALLTGWFDLEGDGESKRISAMMPPGEQRIRPGEIKAFYCQMDEQLWQRSLRLVVQDDKGNRFAAKIRH